MVHENIIVLLVVMTASSLVFGIAYLFFTTRHKERMSMIEKGLDASLLISKRARKSYIPLRMGSLLVGIALGIFIGNVVGGLGIIQYEPAVFANIFLFGGTALLVSFFIERKLIKEDRDNTGE